VCILRGPFERDEELMTDDNTAQSAASDEAFNEAGAMASGGEMDAIAAAETRATEATDRFLRLAAEFDNFKKRAAREREEALRNGIERAVMKILPVMDSFEMAMAATQSTPDASVESLRAGVEMIRSQLKSALAEVGVTELDALGGEFNPAFHEAVSQQADDSVPEGTVLQQLRKGYQLREKLIRPASVVVARKSGA